MKKIRIALDGNEANVVSKVGSNVYAFEILSHLEEITRQDLEKDFTILLSRAPNNDLPSERPGWKYRQVLPKKLWTQWALPLHLFFHQKKYDVFFTPGHYAPRISFVPYVSSIMDLAFLEHPKHFQKSDLFQLKEWTQYSVKNATKIIAISDYTKKKILEYYHRKAEDIIVAYPSLVFSEKPSQKMYKKFTQEHKITQPFILYFGTLQPRKNLLKLIEAFEIFCRSLASQQLQAKSRGKRPLNPIKTPQLVLAGKIGWKTQSILERVEKSPLKKQIVLTGFVPNSVKKILYEKAECLALVGIHEGFGIPALESLAVGTTPVVSQTSSLPEVVGQAGIQVNPNHSHAIAKGFMEIWSFNAKKKALYKRRSQVQVKKFSWEMSAQKILQVLIEVVEKQTERKK